MDKLIKSFIALKKQENLEKDEIITLKRHQAQVPLNQDELCFESEKNRVSFTFKFLKSEVGKSVNVHELFPSIHDKFDYIS